MAKVAIKSEKLSPFGGIFFIPIHLLSNHTKLSYTIMSLLFAASGVCSRTIISKTTSLLA